MAAGVFEAVIATKLFKPDPRHQTVQRERLHDLLRQGSTLPLTLIVAPAGWGKSTLVADWLARDRVAAVQRHPSCGDPVAGKPVCYERALPPAGRGDDER